MAGPGRRGAGALWGGLVGTLAAGLVVVGLAGARSAPAGVQVHAPRRGFLTATDAGVAAQPWRWQLDPGVRWTGEGEAVSVRPALAPDGRLWLGLGRARVELTGEGAVRATGLECPAGLRWTGEVVTLDAAGLRVGEVRACPGSPGAGPWLEAGARRATLRDLAWGGRPVAPRLPPARAALLLAGGAALGVALRPSPALLLPLLAGLVLIGVDPAAAAEALWVQALATPWLPAAVGLGGAALLQALLRAAAASSGRRALPGAAGPATTLAWAGAAVAAAHDGLQALVALGGVLALALASWALGRRLAIDGRPPLLVGATAAVLAVAAGLPADPVGALGLGAAAAALSWVVAVNLHARRLPAFNLLSLGGVALALVGLELGLAHAHPARAWRAALTWNARHVQALGEDDVALEAMDDFDRLAAGRHPAYPARGYPVAYGPRAVPTRIVALGGSSTGGAWQFDDLALFYPARLDTLLGPEVEVVNQGVGGWTSWHVRRYLEAHLDRLDADLLTLYLGNNDAGGGYPAPISQLHAAWQARAQRGPARLLDALALVQWLRVSLAPRVQATHSAAVPVEEHAAHLAAIVALAGSRRVLLIGEANSEGGRNLRPWYEAQAALAQRHGNVSWLSGADALPPDVPGLFLDHAHPTEAGHQRLAEAIAHHLRQLGWVPPG